MLRKLHPVHSPARPTYHCAGISCAYLKPLSPLARRPSGGGITRDACVRSFTHGRDTQGAREHVRNCTIRVNMDLVRELRADLGGREGRKEAFEFMSNEFRANADMALADLGYPEIALSSAWDVFVAVVDILRHS